MSLVRSEEIAAVRHCAGAPANPWPNRKVTKQQPPGARFTVAIGEDGLPVIRTQNGVITSGLVKEIESQTR